MIEMGLRDLERPILQKDLAFNLSISNKYMDSILSALKAAGLIENSAGKRSGYIFAKPPSKISVYMVFVAFAPERNIIMSKCNPCIFDASVRCPAHEFWYGLNNQMIQYMQSVKISSLINEQKDFLKGMQTGLNQGN